MHFVDFSQKMQKSLIFDPNFPEQKSGQLPSFLIVLVAQDCPNVVCYASFHIRDYFLSFFCCFFVFFLVFLSFFVLF